EVYSAAALAPEAARTWADALVALVPLVEASAGARGCPRCGGALAEERGALFEDVCPAGHGRFLPPAAAERLLFDEEGLDRETLRELAAHFAGQRLLCPGCGASMSPLTVRAVAADLCLSCGGLWLDEGELAKLSGGRHAEERQGS